MSSGNELEMLFKLPFVLSYDTISQKVTRFRRGYRFMMLYNINDHDNKSCITVSSTTLSFRQT